MLTLILEIMKAELLYMKVLQFFILSACLVLAINKIFKYTAFSACRTENLELVKLLMDLGAECNDADLDGWTPLYDAIVAVSIKLTKFSNVKFNIFPYYKYFSIIIIWWNMQGVILALFLDSFALFFDYDSIESIHKTLFINIFLPIY